MKSNSSEFRSRSDQKRQLGRIIALACTGYLLLFFLLSWWMRSSFFNVLTVREAIEAKEVVASIQSFLLDKELEVNQRTAAFFRRLDKVVKLENYGHGVKRVRIFDREAHLVYATDSVDLEDVAIDDLDEVMEALKGAVFTYSHSEDASEVLEYFEPLYNKDRDVIGAAEVYFDISAFTQGVRATTAKIFVMAAASFLLFSLLILRYSSSVFYKMDQARREKEESNQRARDYQELARSGILLSGLSHQLRNPIAIIKGVYSSLAKRAMNDEQKPFVRALGETAERLDRLVESFLRFASPVSRNGAFEQASVREQLLLAIAKHKELGNQINPLIEGGDLRVAVQPELLEELFAVLLQNSAEALQGGVLFLRAQIVLQNDKVKITYEDNGPGFSPALLENPDGPFRPFLSTKSGGSGLGLALARRLVEEHGWKIEASNCPEGGARIIIELPRAG